MLPFPTGTPGMQQMAVQGVAPGQQPILNVRTPSCSPNPSYLPVQDALSYLDQVKVQFSGDPHVYNQFLDIMKDFKSQAIDTPGVIRRVSTLFTGHPNLISGFNTFLPPGYKIECGTEDDPNAIRVTTPMGTQVSPMGSSLRPLSNPRAHGDAAAGGRRDEHGPFDANVTEQSRWDPQRDGEAYHAGRPQGTMYGQAVGPGNPRMSPFAGSRESAYGVNEMHLAREREMRNVSQLHDAAVSAATTMSPLPESSALAAAGAGMIGPAQSALGMEKRGPVEFNHAISYVNKIKNRFAQQPEIYKQFLEILQTYQRESRPIQDVYAQVTKLFDGAPDLLQDFKQFLPDSAAQARESEAKKAAEDATMISSVRGDGAQQHTPRGEQNRMPPMGNFAPTPSHQREKKRKHTNERQGIGGHATNGSLNDYGSRNNGNLPGLKRGKHSHLAAPQQPATAPNAQPSATKYVPQPDNTPVEPMLVPQLPEPLQPTSSLAPSGDELAFFDRVKKHISNKNSMTEFLKLCNLYSNDLIDKNLLVFRAQNFIGGSPELFEFFKRFINYDGRDQLIENRARPASGRVNLNNCRSLGQSYRHLPQRERQKACSGRDELCNSVLNDEWVSHPTWASEDSGFIAHKKNVHEEGLHRIEEERHDYDLNISSLERLIQFLEPFAQQIRSMSELERTSWQLSTDFAGQSFPIYRKVLTRIYGREHTHYILNDISTRPTYIVPVVLQRCRITCEQWKATQREWEKVWRDQTQRMFWKSLDHQGIQAKQGDKRQFQTKTLQNEIQMKFEEQKRQRISNIKDVPHHQFEYRFEDEEVLLDASRLILHYADANHSVDVPSLLVFLKEFIPSFFGFDPERFHEQMDSFTSDTPPEDDVVASLHAAVEDDNASEDSSVSRGRRAAGRKSDLRRGVLDKGRNGRSGGNAERSASASRATTPDVASPAEEDVEPMDDSTGDDVETWVQHPTEGNRSRRRGDVKPNQPFKRRIFNLYANLPIFCFFRMFTTFYDRLYKLKLAEPVVKATVRRMKAMKPASDLRMVDKDPDNFFTDTGPNADFYKQMLGMFEELVKGDGQIEMGYIEDTLRRFYLGNGWMLYSFERMLSAVTRFAIAIITPDGKDRSNDLIALFNKDRKKAETTHQDEVAYRKQVEKHIKDGDVYRITYVSKPKAGLDRGDQADHKGKQHEVTRTTYFRILKSGDATYEYLAEDGLLDADQRWAYYVASYTSVEPTEGVSYEAVTWPYRQSHVRQAEALADEVRNSASRQYGASGGEEGDEGQEGEDKSATAAAAEAHRKLTWRSNENLGLRISPDTYQIFWPRPGSGNDEEWWQTRIPRSSSKQQPPAGRGGQGAASDGDEAGEDKGGKSASGGQKKEGTNKEGGEAEAEESRADQAFEEKFIMNNRWMAGLRRDEVEEKNAGFLAWTGQDGGDTVMEG